MQIIKAWPKDYNDEDVPDTRFHKSVIKQQASKPALPKSYIGQRGSVTEIYPPANKIIVDGVNMGPHYEDPSLDYPNGRVVQKPRFIPYDCVLLVDPATEYVGGAAS